MKRRIEDREKQRFNVKKTAEEAFLLQVPLTI